MKTARFILTCLAVTVCATAQAATAPTARKMKQVREVTDNYADCVVRENARKAREFVGNNLSEDVVNRQFRSLNDGTCLSSSSNGRIAQVTFPSPHFRYAIARAIVRADYGSKGMSTFNAVPALVYDAVPVLDETKLPAGKRKAEKLRQGYSQAAAALLLSQFGECAVRSNPEAARALIVSKENFPERLAAIAGVKPVLGGCLTQGTLKLNTFNLIGALAVGYVRLAYQAGQATPSASQSGTIS